MENTQIKKVLEITFYDNGKVDIDTELNISQMISALEEELIYFKAKRKLIIEEQVKEDMSKK